MRTKMRIVESTGILYGMHEHMPTMVQQYRQIRQEYNLPVMNTLPDELFPGISGSASTSDALVTTAAYGVQVNSY